MKKILLSFALGLILFPSSVFAVDYNFSLVNPVLPVPCILDLNSSTVYTCTGALAFAVADTINIGLDLPVKIKVIGALTFGADVLVNVDKYSNDLEFISSGATSVGLGNVINASITVLNSSAFSIPAGGFIAGFVNVISGSIYKAPPIPISFPPPTIQQISELKAVQLFNYFVISILLSGFVMVFWIWFLRKFFL